MSNLPGLFVMGEANFSDHGANRLGASALMQGLADGYFVIPYTIGQYFVTAKPKRLPVDHADFKRTAADVQDRINRLLSVKGKQSAAVFHNRLGRLLWENCGMARTKASLEEVIRKIPALREEFWNNVSVTGSGQDMNMALEYAGRVADFLEFGELMSRDALDRNESCGAHFREEFQTAEGEPQRNDEEYSFVSAWQYEGPDKPPVLNREPLTFEHVKPAVRSYK
jgi:succinate dehydrogenase / fumarate reductase, flavoprotein subunit